LWPVSVWRAAERFNENCTSDWLHEQCSRVDEADLFRRQSFGLKYFGQNSEAAPNAAAHSRAFAGSDR
jgi:hypothetical protein